MILQHGKKYDARRGGGKEMIFTEYIYPCNIHFLGFELADVAPESAQEWVVGVPVLEASVIGRHESSHNTPKKVTKLRQACRKI